MRGKMKRNTEEESEVTGGVANCRNLLVIVLNSYASCRRFTLSGLHQRNFVIVVVVVHQTETFRSWLQTHKPAWHQRTSVAVSAPLHGCGEIRPVY